MFVIRGETAAAEYYYIIGLMWMLKLDGRKPLIIQTLCFASVNDMLVTLIFCTYQMYIQLWEVVMWQ